MELTSTQPVEDIATADAAAVAARPALRRERVETIDILRGLALFGILAANIRGFAGPATVYFRTELYWPGVADRIAQGIVDIFVQRKFITIFAVLFGVGFASQLDRLEGMHARFGRVYARRLLILAGFGVLHGLFIWFGDILLIYALTGFFLLLFRHAQQKTLVKWSVIGYCIPLAIMLAATLTVTLSSTHFKPPPVPGARELAEVTRVFASGSFAEIQHARAADAVRLNWGYFPIVAPQIFGLFLAGMLAWRNNLFRPAPEALPLYRRTMVVAAAVGIPGNVITVVVTAIYDLPPFAPRPLSAAMGMLGAITVPALSLAYVCGVIVLANDARWHPRLQPFGSVGRMALTNYLTQSVIGTLLFYSYGLGWFGKAGPALLVIPTIAIFAAQIAFSRWWLARWRFGPAEWLWRSLTYAKLQPMAIEREDSGPTASL